MSRLALYVIDCPERFAGPIHHCFGPDSRNRMVRDQSRHIRTLAETGLAPAIQDPLDQVVRDCAVVGNMLMTLFAFPGSFKNPGYLFDYCGHLFLQ